MGEIHQLPKQMIWPNLSSNEPDEPGNCNEPGNCQYCGKERITKSTDLMGEVITVTLPCACEIREHEKELAYIKAHGERERADIMRRNSGLVHAAAEMTFATFVPRNGTEKALQKAREFVNSFKDRLAAGEGFVFIGEYGNGKSHLAAATVHELINRGITASYQVTPELLKRVRATFNGSGQRETEAGILEVLQGVKCLVLDDLGAQKQTEWAEEFLYTVIDHRYRRRLPTIITSNCSGVDGEKSLVEALGGRAVDRILERCAIIRVTATSYRRELARRRLNAKGA